MSETKQRKLFKSRKSKFFAFVLLFGFVVYNSDYFEFIFFYKHICKFNAVDIGDGNKFGACDRKLYSEYGEIIVYDTSDKIKLGENLAARNVQIVTQFSPQWLKSYKEFPLPDLNGDYGYVLTPIWGSPHFYRLRWS